MSDKSTRRRKNQRTDGRYMVQMTVGTKPDGKPIRKSFYGATKKEAMEKKEAYQKRMEAGIVENKLTVSEWVEEYLKIYKPNLLSSPWSSIYLIPYRYIIKSLGSVRLDSIREADLQREINSFANCAKATISRYSQAIKNIFSSAHKNRLIAHDPSLYIMPPPGTSGTHRALTRPEIMAITNHWAELPGGLWAMIMLWAGLRRGEMAALDWSAVDMDQRVLYVRQSALICQYRETVIKPGTKTDAGVRSIPICTPLWSALNTIPEDQRIGLICSEPDGSPLLRYTTMKTWKKMNIQMANDFEKPVQMHDLRHTFATMLYDAGVPVKAAQYYMGHRSIAMTMDLYTHLSAEKQHESANTLVQFLDSFSPENRLP